MDKITLSQETHKGISQAMALANKKFQETPSERFETNFRELILKEIENGTNAANNFRLMIPSATDYTYTNTFPLPVYEALTEETLLMLELSNIYLSKNEQRDTARIRIIFHF